MQLRILAFTALSMLPFSLRAGVVMETLSRDLDDPDPKAATTIITHAQNGRMRVETKPEGSVMIFKDDVIYHLDAKDKTYVAMDRASLKRMADQINPALQQMREQLARMPPEQRAQVEKMMGGRAMGAVEAKPQDVRKTTRAGKAAGRACTYVEVREGGELTEELCVASAGSLPEAQELLAAAKAMSALLQEMLASIDAPSLKEAARNTDFERIGGVPLLAREFAGGKPVNETVLQSIRTEALSAALFEVPAGFVKKDLSTH